MHALAEPDDAERGFHVFLALGFREFGKQQRKLNVLKRRKHRDQVVHLKDKTDVARAPASEIASGHAGDFVAIDGDGAARRDVQAAEKI